MARIYTALGLMSGTSLDGIDAAIIRTDGAQKIEFCHAAYHPYDRAFKAQMQTLAQQDIPLIDVLQLEQELTTQHASLVLKVIEDNSLTYSEIDVIGFHGQTIRHLPQQGLTWQLGDAQLLAEQTKVPVVANFRKRDMAAGGEGAPLAPLYHQALLANIQKPCAVLNLGGVGNITYLGLEEEVIATDTGPANGLLDAWLLEHTGKMYDDQGQLAATGTVDAGVVNKALAEIPFFQRPLPRSADRYDFDGIDMGHLNVADGAATLVALTVASVKQVVAQLPAAPATIYVSGGGVHNTYLMAQLNDVLGNVQPVSAVGLREDTLEAECFAWLAVRHLIGQATSIPSTTGCGHATVGGILTAPCIL